MTYIAHPSIISRASIDHLSNNSRTSLDLGHLGADLGWIWGILPSLALACWNSFSSNREHLVNTYQKPIEHLLKMNRTSIANRPNLSGFLMHLKGRNFWKSMDRYQQFWIPCFVAQYSAVFVFSESIALKSIAIGNLANICWELIEMLSTFHRNPIEALSSFYWIYFEIGSKIYWTSIYRTNTSIEHLPSISNIYWACTEIFLRIDRSHEASSCISKEGTFEDLSIGTKAGIKIY